MKDLKKSDMKVVPFDKGVGFAVLEKSSMVEKIEEHLKDAKVVKKDPTNSLMRKFQREISALLKDEKIDKLMFYKLYPSDAIPPRLYGFVKAHKPTKQYPMRPVVSTVGTAFYGSSKFLVDLLQPTLNRNLTRVKNSSTFAEEARSWDISANEVQVSYDVVNLYPSVPIGRSIDVVMDFVKDDFDEICQRTKLKVDDIEILLRLCLSKCYFLWDEKIFEIKDAGPIGLSLMVTMAEAYLQHLESRALSQAINCCPKTFRRYVDDSHVRFNKTADADEFLDILNSQDCKIQYTIERESLDGVLPFLDISLKNNRLGKYEMKVFRKGAITNLQIHPGSSVDPTTILGVFKGFLTRANRICTPCQLQQEVKFLVDMFVENGYDRKKFQDIADSFVPNSSQNLVERDEEESSPIVKLPWIPKVGPNLRKVFKKHGVRVVFTAGPSLNDILCQHKSPLPRNSRPGVYKLECGCSSIYIGETKKKVSSRVNQHEKDIFHGRWAMSGAAEHAEKCSQRFKFEEATTVSVEETFHSRKVREAVEIRMRRRKDAKVVNRDSGSYLKTSQWDVLLSRVSDVNH